MTPLAAVRSGFKQYVTFSGRASRSAFWYWMLATTLLNVVCVGLDAALFGVPVDSEEPGWISTVWSLAVFVPSIAVAVRRLHDANRRGGWLLLSAVTIFANALMQEIGAYGTGISIATLAVCSPMLLVIYWLCSKGTPGENRFGPDPLAGKEGA